MACKPVTTSVVTTKAMSAVSPGPVLVSLDALVLGEVEAVGVGVGVAEGVGEGDGVVVGVGLGVGAGVVDGVADGGFDGVVAGLGV